MKQNNPSVDAVTTQSHNYSFTAIPSNFIYLFDNYTFKLLSILIQKESYWKNKGNLNDGFFALRNEDIIFALQTNRNEVTLTIESLYISGIIDVDSCGWVSGQRKCNRYKINWDKINELAQISFQDIFDNNLKIEKCKRGTKCTYMHTVKSDNKETQPITKAITKASTNCDATINNIDNKENINNIDNILEYNINNILIEKEEIKEDTQHLGGVADTALTQPFYSNLVEEKKESQHMECVEDNNNFCNSIIMDNSKEEVKKEEKATTPTLFVVVDNSKEIQLTFDQLSKYMEKKGVEDVCQVVAYIIKDGKRIDNDLNTPTVEEEKEETKEITPPTAPTLYYKNHKIILEKVEEPLLPWEIPTYQAIYN